MATVKVTLRQGAMRACCSLREGALGAKRDNKARQRSRRPGPCTTVADRGKQGKPGNSSQVQPRVQITRQVCGDEVGLKSSHEIRSGSVLVMVTRIRHTPIIARQVHSDAVYSRSETKVGRQSPGQGLDQQGLWQVWEWSQQSWRQAYLQHNPRQGLGAKTSAEMELLGSWVESVNGGPR